LLRSVAQAENDAPEGRLGLFEETGIVGEVNQFEGVDLLKDWRGPAKGCLKASKCYGVVVNIKK
jgi:hypothetical protein